MDIPILNQLDQVQLLTTKGISYRSSPPGEEASPHGLWSVIGIMGDNVLLSKNTTIVLAPIMNVKKVYSNNIKEVFKKFEILHEQNQQIIGNIDGEATKEGKREDK